MEHSPLYQLTPLIRVPYLLLSLSPDDGPH